MPPVVMQSCKFYRWHIRRLHKADWRLQATIRGPQSQAPVSFMLSRAEG